MFNLIPYGKNHTSSLYEPFRALEDWERQFFSDWPGMGGSGFKTDILDEGKSYRLEAELPGFDKEDIHLDISGNLLTIRAERKKEQEKRDGEGRVIHSERSFRSVSRSFDVSDIRSEEIRAAYDKGILSVTLPKREAEQPESRRLEIE